MSDDKAILVSRNSREVRVAEGSKAAQRPRGEAVMGDARQVGTQRTKIPPPGEDGLSHAQIVVRPARPIKVSRPPAALVEVLKARRQSAPSTATTVFQTRGLDMNDRINKVRDANARLARDVQAIEAERRQTASVGGLKNEAHQLTTVELRAGTKAITAGRKR